MRGLSGPENQSQLKMIWWNRDWRKQFFWGNHGNVHAGTFTVWLLSNLDLIEEQILLCCLKSPASQRRNSPKSLRTFTLSDQDEGKKKAYWKQSKYIYFSLGFFSFSHFFCVCVCGSWLMTQVWGTTHITGGQAGCLSSTWDSSAEALQGKEGQIVAPFHLWPLSLWDSARGDDWIRLWMSAELWAYSSELLTDRISFVTVEGYDGLEPTAV